MSFCSRSVANGEMQQRIFPFCHSEGNEESLNPENPHSLFNMNMLKTLHSPITLEEFLNLPETKPAQEFINGKIVQKPIPQGQHSTIQGELTTAINTITKPTSTAWAFPELRCTFGGRSIVLDIAVFTWERIPTNEDGTIANSFKTYPDWTIEILSPEQSAVRVTSNILHCLNHGTQMGWLIDPQERLVIVYTQQKPSFFDLPESVLPAPEFVSNFELTLGQLFDWLIVKK
jgi:Uma2 family endonuclease